MNYFAAVVLASACCTVSSAESNQRLAPGKPVQALSAAQAKVQQEALTAFRTHRYAAAFGRFAELADAGHVPSAEAALFMLRQGPSIFGSDWTASVPQQASWQALVINNTRSRTVALDDGKGE